MQFQMSFAAGLEDNIFADVGGDHGEESDEVNQTPPPSPEANKRDIDKPGLFSLAQVQIKLNELWSTTRERIFGEDYWIPSDSFDVVGFPSEFLKLHKTVYPPHAKESSHSVTLKVVQCIAKPDIPNLRILNHVVYTHYSSGEKETLSLFRTEDLGEAMDFCRRCEECRALFKMLGFSKDICKQIRDLTNKLQSHPLWRMVHISIACGRTDVFTDDGYEYLQKMGYTSDDLVKPIASPEGQYPLMMAIESNQPEIVKFLIKLGADITARDLNGNSCLHYAALASTQMIEIVWSCPEAKELLNCLNNDRLTPALLAIRNANPFCLKLLINLGAEINLRVAGKNPLFEAVQSKGKTIEVIKAILEAQPQIINETEEATGNNVLHSAMYKMPLLGLLNLRHKELDLNGKNKAGLTPLHLYCSRGDVGMIITITSYGCDLNAKDRNGNTALHVAVSKSKIVITRLLLSLGADPNVINNHGDSPRHLAAKLNEEDLLKTLVICGAKRCPHSKSGCVSGCVNERSVRFLSRTSVSSEATVAPSPRSLATIEKIEHREEHLDHPWNRLHEVEHQAIFEEMIEFLNKMIEQKKENNKKLCVLSLDGGGIRGLVIVQILLEIERVMGEPIFPYFDWIAGTSTGALVATGMCQGKTLRQCQMVYLRFKDLIFDGWVRPYKPLILETFIKVEMGEDTLMSDLIHPRLMFTTTRADVFPVQLEYMRNYRLPLSDEENIEIGYNRPRDLHLWKALRRTSAAPTYFSCAENRYIDGGIISNNPTLDLMGEIQMHNTVSKHLKRDQEVEIGCILSIGTGVIPTIPMDAGQLDLSSNPYSSAVAIKNLGIILVDQVTATEGAPVARASSWCINQRIPYFRFSSPLFKDIAMDTTDDLVLARMMWDAMEYMYRHHSYIDKLCTLLKKLGHSELRKRLFLTEEEEHELLKDIEQRKNEKKNRDIKEAPPMETEDAKKDKKDVKDDKNESNVKKSENESTGKDPKNDEKIGQNTDDSKKTEKKDEAKAGTKEHKNEQKEVQKDAEQTNADGKDASKEVEEEVQDTRPSRNTSANPKADGNEDEVFEDEKNEQNQET
ncbi:unnamed protein product [Bursaphelenchus okinawaensis]|uniref:phospholipase A2 n=1 Tax=Bursaphelenchus okinawaensis TaxID=465554 RepID=A0A811KHQ7_9BILA|nr:unnamed protein product [Bursaphelenchus okinawaensis]CAG9104807.1 unnamed protein product [Bursaphelenchus okinawaensis]